MSEAEAKAISNAKDKIKEVVPSPPEQHEVASAQELKERLDWGEPALTIIDIRDREAYLQERIMGAMPMFSENTSQRITDSLAPNRAIYVYGESDDKTAEAAQELRSAGFKKVSQLQGGLAGWKAIGGPTEGTERDV
ncbi:rhodanese-like domain-containing protein [Myxosarcina sp. GI1]|uniref:rhodanese-like domain-containing protein n=1 Tax=Myxosarcina sp. GI1 TaxID=1541065 RepID=UPI000690FA14|nr:rhodanese-like domain-containing protein [Myxosarcina sp. GI1]